METCVFDMNDAKILAGFFQDDRSCTPNDHIKCDTYSREGPCLVACKLIAKYGQGLKLMSVMRLLNNIERKRYTSCFPNKIYGKGGHGIVLSLVCSENDRDFTSYALKLVKINARTFHAHYLDQMHVVLHLLLSIIFQLQMEI